jgi:hypothetical protein
MRRALAIADRLRLAAAVASVALFAAREAGAYCRSAACPPHDPNGTTAGQRCNPPSSMDCGVELQWRQPCVGFNVQQDGSKQIDAQTAETILTQAFNAWAPVTLQTGEQRTTMLDCGGGPPTIQVFDLGPVPCDKVEYNQHGGNANILIFRDDAWPHDTGGGGVDTLALTTVTYDVDKGDIYDADIEVNTADNQFTTTSVMGQIQNDLLSVLTHETGHYFGIAHTTVMPATMYPSYNEGTTDIRTLAQDDVAAICATYPIDRTPDGVCSGLPRHGWAPECFSDQTYVTCAVAQRRGSPRLAVDPARGPWERFCPLFGLAALAIVLRARRGSRGW